MKISFYNKSIEQKVIKFIRDNNLINFGDKILVAFSGGADSVFLLNFLVKFQSKYNIELAAFHLNHLLRNESLLDQNFSKKFCTQLNVPFFTINKKVGLFAKKNKISVEEAGRIYRYKYFNIIAKKHSFNKIATAHNLDDNTETVLLNLIKGKGLRALAGIPIKQDNVIRPVMCLTKSEIKKYLKLNDLSYAEDLTNQNEMYERNYLRLKIIREIVERLNRNLNNTVFQTSKILEDYLKFFYKVLDEKYIQVLSITNKDVLLNFSLLENEFKIIQTEIIRRIFIQELKIEPAFKNIEDIIRLAKSQTGRRVKISSKYEVFKEGKLLRFSEIKKRELVNVRIKLGKSNKINQKIVSVKKTNNVLINKDSNVEIIDADKIIGELRIRNWQKGDKFYPLGLKGSKKISDFLTDLKINSQDRNEVLILTDEEKIVCVLGYRIDDRVKITDNSKNFYKIKIKNGK